MDLQAIWPKKTRDKNRSRRQRPPLADSGSHQQPLAVASPPRQSDSRELHTVTIQEAARLLDAAGVPRSQRPLVRWCSPDAHGVGRLECVYDGNERRYWITPESIERAIEEEKAKQAPGTRAYQQPEQIEQPVAGDEVGIRELKLRMRDLEINNRAKDVVIERYEKDRDTLLNLVAESNHKIGSLETELRALQEPEDSPKQIAG